MTYLAIYHAILGPSPTASLIFKPDLIEASFKIVKTSGSLPASVCRRYSIELLH